MYGYIYKTTNVITGKIYIGQKHSNVFLGNKYLGSGKILKQAINKDGYNNFVVDLIEEVETQEKLDEREIFWINYFNATDRKVGYNICEGGKVNRTMIGENNPFYGKHHTDEVRQKMSNSQQHRTDDRSHTEESKQKLSQKMKGRKITWKDKISENAKINLNYGMKNKHVNEETKKNLSEKALNRWSNEEEKDKQRHRVKNAWQNEEYRKKHCAAMRGKKRTIITTECPFCKKQIRKCNYNRHIETHLDGRYEEKQKHYHLDRNDLFCKFCNKEFKNRRSLSAHERRCKYRAMLSF